LDSNNNIPLIEAENISHSFDYQLFDNINILLIMGRSGSGKSTLLHILSTMIKPNSGIVKLFGKDIYSMSKSQIELIRREKLGIIFQQHFLFKGMTALENIEAATLLANTKVDKEIFEMLEIDNANRKFR